MPSMDYYAEDDDEYRRYRQRSKERLRPTTTDRDYYRRRAERDEGTKISPTYDLGIERNDPIHGQPGRKLDAPEWTKPKYGLSDGSATHVQNVKPKMDTLEKLVMDCPFISLALKSAALRLIVQAQQDPSAGGFWDTNEHDKNPEDELVVLLRMPYLAPAKSGNNPGIKPKEKAADALFSVLYGDDVVIRDDSATALRKLALPYRPGLLRVPRLLCVLLGTGLMITMSEFDLEDTYGDLIQINNRSYGEFRTVQVKRYQYSVMAYPIVVDMDCKYVDFLRHAVAIAAAESSDPSLYDIFWLADQDLVDKDILTPAKWIQLLSSDEIEKGVFCLALKRRPRRETYERLTDYRTRRDRSYERFRIRDERRRMAALDQDQHQGGEADPVSRPPTNLLISEAITDDPRASNSKAGTIDQEGTTSSREIDSKGGGIDPHARTEEDQTDPLPSAAASQSGSSDDEQITTEAALEIIEISTGPLPLTTFERRWLWKLIVPFDPERLLPWRDDLPSIQASPLSNSLRPGSLFRDPDFRLGKEIHLDEHDLNTDRADDDGIRIITVEPEDYNHEDGDGANVLPHRNPVSSRDSHDTKSTNNLVLDGVQTTALHTQVPERFSENSLGVRKAGRRRESKTREGRRQKPQEPPNKSSGLVTFPIFTWRVRQGSELQPELYHEVQCDETVVRILANIHGSIASTKSGFSAVYLKAYRCTADDLFLRHPDLVTDTRTGGNPEDRESHGPTRSADDHGISQRNTSSRDNTQHAKMRRTTSEGNSSDSDSSVDEILVRPRTSQASEKSTGERFEKPKTARSVEMTPSRFEDLADPDDTGDQSMSEPQGYHEEKRESSDSLERRTRGLAMKRDILETSQSIFQAFLPSQSSSSHPDYYHPICERFWGSLDEILRQINWRTLLYRDDLTYVVRDFDNALPAMANSPEDAASKKKRSFTDCEACSKGHIYVSPANAVKHIHDVHLSCTAAKSSSRIHDDPCVVWVKEATGEPGLHPAASIRVRDFVECVSNFSEKLSEIQWLVASSSKGVKRRVSRPRLPSSLVHAFETLLSYYVLTAKGLSLMNRSLYAMDKTETKTDRLFSRLATVTRRLADVGEEAMARLTFAKRDILLEGTKDEVEDTLGLQVVGAEFLIAALITMTQNRSIHPPEESGRYVNAQSSMRLVDMYKKYNNQIHFEANRRPQRRVFIVIHELEEELRAIKKVFSRQEGILRWYMETIDPRWSDLANDARRSSYTFEKKYIKDQCSILIQREAEIERIEKTAAPLKLHVGRMIGILEEDHGKAIRVFTVVTLFFLPMSFVTSFMGMNTSDIRDMESNQQLFWSIAAPVTAFVLTVAFLYGYKGEEIADLFAQLLPTRVRQEEKAPVVAGPRRQSTWLTLESKDDDSQRSGKLRFGGRVGQVLMRHRKSRTEEVMHV